MPTKPPKGPVGSDQRYKENNQKEQQRNLHQEYANSAEDTVERAFFDLQDAKTNFFQE